MNVDDYVTQLTNSVRPLVSPEDEWVLEKWTWRKRADGYWVRYTTDKGKRQTIRLHRLIMGEPEDMVVDHVNGDPDNNRRENLRVCTQSQNRSNSSPKNGGYFGFKGIRPRGTKWQAQLKGKALGMYNTPEEAAKAYDAYARVVYGEYARLNFPDAV